MHNGFAVNVNPIVQDVQHGLHRGIRLGGYSRRLGYSGLRCGFCGGLCRCCCTGGFLRRGRLSFEVQHPKNEGDNTQAIV